MDTLFLIIEYIGIIAFTVSGAMIAIHKEADLFGVVLLSVMTAFCGGLFRDLCLGITPPTFLVSAHIKVAVSVGVALLVFLIAALFKKQYVKNEERIDRINNIFDAIGLGMFAVLGTQVSIEAGQSGAFISILMGLFSGVGGGMFRDLCLGTVPFIIRKRIYAVAALIGSSLYYLIAYVAFGNSATGATVGVVISIITVVTIRLLATTFKWNMPKAIRFDEFK